MSLGALRSCQPAPEGRLQHQLQRHRTTSLVAHQLQLRRVHEGAQGADSNARSVTSKCASAALLIGCQGLYPVWLHGL